MKTVILSLVDPQSGSAESVECYDNPANLAVELHRFACEHDVQIQHVEASVLALEVA